MIETLIREAADRFHLGGNAGALVKALVDAIFNPRNGGFAGLRSQFANAGLGYLFGSWIGATPGDNALQPDQFAAGMGSSAVDDIAGKAGIPASTVSAAGAFLLPKIVGALTPAGQIPNGPPGWLDGLFGGFGSAVHGAGDAARNLGGAAGAAVGTAGSALRGAGAGLERSTRPASGGGFWKWLIALLVLAGIFFGYRSCQHTDRTATPAAETAAPVAQAPPPVVDAATTATDADANPAMPAADATAVPAAADASADPNAAADSALSAIKTGASAEDVTKALNLMIIHFATGSATIDKDSDAILAKAADAIKSLPAGSKLEVGGHTDNTGNAAANTTLSQKRADAVVARLGELGVAAGTLTGKGYGDSKPVADNGTAEGRAKNRRIEFTAAQ